MIRVSDWQTRLSAYLQAASFRPFEYGVQDCGLFVAGAVEAMTGVDVAAELRGRYRTRGQAFDRIRELTGRGSMIAVADFVARRYRLVLIPPLSAQRGDAVQDRSGRLGIVAMHGWEILTPYKDGLLRLPLGYAARAWRI